MCDFTTENWILIITALILFLQFVVFAFQGRQLKKTVDEMKKAASLDVGSVEISFQTEKIVEIIVAEAEKSRFKVNFAIVHSGKSMLRIISTQFNISKRAICAAL